MQMEDCHAFIKTHLHTQNQHKMPEFRLWEEERVPTAETTRKHFQATATVQNQNHFIHLIVINLPTAEIKV